MQRSKKTDWNSVVKMTGLVLAGTGLLLMPAQPAMGQDRVDHRNVTLSGTVTRDLMYDDFVLRAANGFTYRISPKWDSPQSLSVGDRVRAHGNWSNGALQAGNIRILREGDQSDASRTGHENITMTGTIVDANSGDGFVLKASNGWTYPVRPVYEEKSVSVGDRVRVHGVWGDGMLRAGNLRRLYDGGAARPIQNSGSRAQTTNSGPSPRGNMIRGVVTANLDGNEFVVRDAAGYAHRVRALYGEPARLSLGDKVAVRGTWQSGMLQANSISINRQAPPTDASGNPVYNIAMTGTTTGTVVTEPANGHFMIQLPDGSRRHVYTWQSTPSNLSPGDFVRVYGQPQGDVMHGSNVRILTEGPEQPNSVSTTS